MKQCIIPMKHSVYMNILWFLFCEIYHFLFSFPGSKSYRYSIFTIMFSMFFLGSCMHVQTRLHIKQL